MSGNADAAADERRLWLVERTYGDDELNLIILVYATPDGSRYVRKERALTSFADERPTRASITVPRHDLGDVTDESERQRYAEEASRMAAAHDPDDHI
ncbi:hypothetical protein [Halorarum halobium]|uniref:hypothetical protein n=1 Tax=Halorarum halobium TaxID=3075121 RepID=UPI0028AE30A6|nr:hypothetical protein [Halobaculum sp. XH14]